MRHLLQKAHTHARAYTVQKETGGGVRECVFIVCRIVGWGGGGRADWTLDVRVCVRVGWVARGRVFVFVCACVCVRLCVCAWGVTCVCLCAMCL